MHIMGSREGEKTRNKWIFSIRFVAASLPCLSAVLTGERLRPSWLTFFLCLCNLLYCSYYMLWKQYCEHGAEPYCSRQMCTHGLDYIFFYWGLINLSLLRDSTEEAVVSPTHSLLEAGGTNLSVFRCNLVLP